MIGVRGVRRVAAAAKRVPPPCCLASAATPSRGVIIPDVILAYHVIFGAYGFWLPNDPRGSGSEIVWAEHLKAFGPATKVNTRRSVAGQSHNRPARLEAKHHLLYPPVRFTGLQARAVARGICDVSATLELAIHACCVMPDHVHLVISRHRETVEGITGFLKRSATRRPTDEDLHPLSDFRSSRGRTPSPWVRGGWYVYLDTPERVIRAIEYVNGNPVKAGMKPQKWSFIQPYNAPRGRGG